MPYNPVYMIQQPILSNFIRKSFVIGRLLVG